MKVEAVCREFIRLHAQARNKSWREAERILEREFAGTFGQCDIREIKRFDVLEIMDAAVARGSTYQANRILSNIRKLFNWCVERGIVETSPITGLKAPTKEESRERILSDDEIARLLRACPHLWSCPTPNPPRHPCLCRWWLDRVRRTCPLTFAAISDCDNHDGKHPRPSTPHQTDRGS